MMSVMGLGAKCGDTLTVTIEGADEDAAAEAMQAFFKRTCKKSAADRFPVRRPVYGGKRWREKSSFWM